MPKYPTCTFCGKNDSKPSKEHVLPKWVTNEFPDAIKWETINRLTNYTRKTTKHVNITAKHPCENCNNGWLSRLENKAKPILAPLIHGVPTTLSPSAQAVIGIWFFARAVMFDLHSEKATPRVRYFENAEHRLLKIRLACDPYYQFFIAAYAEKQLGFLQEDQLNVRLGTESDPGTDDVRAYAFTLCIEHLILQIFCVKGIDGSTGYVMRNFDRFCAPLIPNASAITWPPERAFSARTVDDFVYRWSRHLGNSPTPPT